MFRPDSPCSTTARLRLQRAAIVMCCAASAACASPNLEPPEIARNLPPAFAGGGVSAQPDDDWWNRFGDPRLAALIEEADSTTVVLPGDRASVSPRGHLILEIEGKADG